mmetsp:Transcript_13897/g.11869  ORF Transcript_13897/g.11869 Transcript_13897/m.11869 type:complete len:134 (-) Transcript_13897:156-557(-)
MLLTELAVDSDEIVTYEISSLIMVREQVQGENGKFKCYMNQKTMDFYIEIPDEKTIKSLSSSTLINMLELAENANAENVYVCLRKDAEFSKSSLRSFKFVGFFELTVEEQSKITMSETHNILKYVVNNSEDDE